MQLEFTVRTDLNIENIQSSKDLPANQTKKEKNFLSFVICSITSSKLDAIKNRIDDCLNIPYEIIEICDANSLSEGYNRGAQRCRGDIIIFCHDDIDFLCDQELWPRLSAHLKHFDLVGVAGARQLLGPMWMSGGPKNWAGMVIHQRKGASYNLTVFDSHAESILPVQALDGVFLAIHREILDKVSFDTETFDGFHGYDIDFTYRCFKAGLRLGACKDLLLIHQSAGNFGEAWQKYAKRFVKKFPEFAEQSINLKPQYTPCTITAPNEQEARRIGNELLKDHINAAPNEPSANDKVDPKYDSWKSRKSMQEIDGELLAEHLHGWTCRPLFNIVIDARLGEDNFLADTLENLSLQWYPSWHLTIIAEFPVASTELLDVPNISWIQCAIGKNTEAFNETFEALPGDWIIFLEAGCSLEPHALLCFGDTINLYPKSCLIYCDEDRRINDRQTGGPHFKPGFNLELLRNMYYLGRCVSVKREILEKIGGLSLSGTASLFDLSLKIAETGGNESLTHLPEILVHTPYEGLREINAEMEHEAVRQHLMRQSINGHVSEGLVSGTQRVIYKPHGNPLVSIIIPSRDQPGYLSHCIESLLAETEYSNFEIIVIDHLSRDPDLLDYLKELSERKELLGRLITLRDENPFNYASLCNKGAEIARGEYLIFLDNDTEFIQREWLSNLIGHIQQEGIAAVSPRLSCPDGRLSILNQGPRILGMAGLAAPITGSTIVDPGYYGNLQVAQEVSALSGSCFLINTQLFRELGGFDQKNTAIHEPILELCLRLRQKNHKIIWTPWVDVIHHNKSTRQRLQTQIEEQIKIEASRESETNYLMRNYLKTLANDPYYHRHLSLQEPYGIEPHIVIDWDTRFHDRLRVLGTPLTGGSGEYRMLAPFRALQKAGLAQCCQIHPIASKQQRVLNPIELARAAPDTLVMQQAIDNLQILRLRQYREYNPDVFVAYSVDDVIGNLPKKHYLYNFQIREGKSRLREALSLCDRLIASTEPIAEFCKDMIEDIVIVPNCIDGERWLPIESLRNQGKRPRVGWAGAQQHLGDLEMIKEVVEATHKEIDWIFMGMCPDALKPFVHEEHPFVPLNQYPEKLATLALDLAIAPLEQVIFNEGKSNLRLLEYGMMGWPVVCTNVYPYSTNNPPVKRVENVTDQWVEAIRERIYDRDAAAREGQALRNWVLQHYLLENNLPPWLAAFSKKR